MGKKCLFTAAALLVATSLSGPFTVHGQSDDATKRAFLQSRNATTSAAPSSASPKKKEKPKPKPATRKKQPAPAHTPAHTPRATPRPASATPAPTPEATPRPSATPEHPVSRETSKPKPTPTPRAKSQAIVVEKSGGIEEEFLPPPPPERRGWFFSRPKYKYLTPQVREAIDKARVAKSRWRYIVIHNSGTRQGNAKAFDYYHRNVRKMQNGMAYHFVIGNGASSRKGGIEIGSRWKQQINGGHVKSDYLNNIAIGICLVGDYDRDLPPKEQLEALDELTTYLRRRVGKTERKLATIKAHKDINPVPTSCPGKRFPYRWLYSRFE